MKIANEYIKDVFFLFGVINGEERDSESFNKELDEIPEYVAFVNAIECAQRDAYNQAIDDVNKLIEEHEEEVYIGVVNDILKLKK